MKLTYKRDLEKDLAGNVEWGRELGKMGLFGGRKVKNCC